MKKTVDARGLSSPHHVDLTRQALMDQRFEEILAIVDNTLAVQDVTKLVKDLKYQTTVEEKHGDYYISITKNETLGGLNLSTSLHGNTVLVISSNVLGQGDDQLGSTLMRSFIYSLSQMEGVLRAIIFINSGVFLTTEGSGVLDYLASMEDRGIEIISNSACLDYYHIQDKIRVGTISNIFAITEKIIEAPRLITF